MQRQCTAILIVLSGLICVLDSRLFAQQGVKDPQAVTLINACLQASGGIQAVASVQDFVASGNMTFNWDAPTQANVSVKARFAANQFRTDATLQTGVRSWSVSNGTGALVDTDQSRNDFTYQTAFALRSLSWPIPDFVNALSDPNSSVSYVGLAVTDQGGQAYQIHIQETYPAGTDPNGALSSASARDYYIDPNTSLVVEIKNTQSSGSPPQPYGESVLFSSYTNINGLLIPFLVTEFVSGQQTWTVQFTTINFNIGLSDADFQL